MKPEWVQIAESELRRTFGLDPEKMAEKDYVAVMTAALHTNHSDQLAVKSAVFETYRAIRRLKQLAARDEETEVVEVWR